LAKALVIQRNPPVSDAVAVMAIPLYRQFLADWQCAVGADLKLTH
jgi:hypothetical protein